MSWIQLSEIVFQFLDFNRMNQKSLSKKPVSIFQSLIQIKVMKKSKLPSAYSSGSLNIKCTVESQNQTVNLELNKREKQSQHCSFRASSE